MTDYAARPPRLLDVHGLDPVAQMEQVMLELTLLLPGQQLCAVLSSEPYSLYRMLDKNGYEHRTHARLDARFDLSVWMREAAP